MDKSSEELFRALEALQEKSNREKEKEWKKLEQRILSARTKKEILDVNSDVDQFMNSDAPEKDKKKLEWCLENLAMLVEAVNGMDDTFLIETVDVSL